MSRIRIVKGAFAAASAAALVVVLPGCNFAPHYERPKSVQTATFKEAVPGGDEASQGWKTAQPNDAAMRNNWWEVYQDPKLNELEERALITRRRDPVDRRRHIVDITDAGLEALDRAEVAQESIEDEILGGLSGSDRMTFRALLVKALDHLPTQKPIEH